MGSLIKSKAINQVTQDKLGLGPARELGKTQLADANGEGGEN